MISSGPLCEGLDVFLCVSGHADHSIRMTFFGGNRFLLSKESVPSVPAPPRFWLRKID